MLLFLLACIDYEVVPPPPVPDPGLELRPGDVEVGACPDAPVTVDLLSVGRTALTVEALELVGSGWTLDPVDLPLRIEPGELATLTARGVGSAELHVTSDAADAPAVTALTVVGNEAPASLMVAPVDETSVAMDADLEVVAFVGDDDDAMAELAVTFTSDLTGTLAVVTPDDAGRVSYTWPAAARPPGPQTVMVTAADACGAIGEARAWFCQDGPYVMQPILEEAWHYEGNAIIAGEVLTLSVDAASDAATALALGTVFDGDDVELSFEVQLAPDGQGLSVILLDADRREGYVGGDGCGLGVGGGVDCTSGPALPGWALALDTHADDGDCLDTPHLAFTQNGDFSAPGPCVATPGIDDGAWHSLRLRIADGSLRVELDGVEVLHDPVAVDFFRGVLGFGTSTVDLPATAGVRAYEAIDFTCFMGD